MATTVRTGRSAAARGDRRGRLARVAARRAAGLAFLLVLATLIGVSVAAYDKAFTPVVPVTLETDHVGNQLQAQSDVKLRGIVVGSVRRVSSRGSGARVDLVLDPDMIDMIPRDVRARLLPKTLFGERYVALEVPAVPAAPTASTVPTASTASTVAATGAVADHLRAHDVIPQDRSASAIELERVLSDVLPLLRTIRPDRLDATLTALSTALAGRGDQLGRTLADLDGYVRQITPSLPDVVADVRGLADTAEVYSAAAPDLLAVLDNLRTTGGTVVGGRRQLEALLATTTELADTGQAVLAENARRLISVATTSRPVLDLLARYSPEYPCLLAGLTAAEPLLEDVFGGGQPGLHLTLEVIRDRGKYTPGEEPRYVARSGPDCHGLPGRAGGNYNPGVHIPDGSAPEGQGTLGRADSAAFFGGADLGTQGAPAEQRLVDALVAPTLGVAPDEVPDIAELLFAPMARGTEVRVS